MTVEGQLLGRDAANRPLRLRTSAEELAALIEAKRAQRPPVAAAEEPVVLRLLDALQQSVAAAARPNAQSAEPKTRKPRGRRALA